MEVERITLGRFVSRKNLITFLCDVSGVFSPRVMLTFFFICTLCAGKPPVAEAGDFNAYDTHVGLYHFTHAFMIDGKTDYYPSVPGSAAPKYGNVAVYPFNIWQGEKENWIDLTSSGLTTFAYYDVDSSEYTQPSMMYPTRRFFVFSIDNDEHYIGDDRGREAEFRDGAEGNFSGRPFTLRVDDTYIEGKFPHVKSTAEQMLGKCVPYIELITAGELTTGFRLRFVDPARPGIALTRSSASDVSAVYRTRLRVAGQFVNIPFFETFKAGSTLERVVAFEKPYKTVDINSVRLSFEFADGFTGNSYVRYFWTFFSAFSGPSGA